MVADVPADIAEVFKINFTTAGDPDVAGYLSVTKDTAWSGLGGYGWLPPPPTIGDGSGPTGGHLTAQAGTLAYSSNFREDGSSGTATFRLDVGSGDYLVDIGASAARTPLTVQVNNVTYWNAARSTSYLRDTRVVAADSSGYLNVKLDRDGTRIHYLTVHRIGQLVTSASVGMGVDPPFRYFVASYDDVGNEAFSAPVEPDIWWLPPEVVLTAPLAGGTDYHIFEWGSPRDDATNIMHLEFKSAGGYRYGYPVHFRAAQIEGSPEMVMDPNAVVMTKHEEEGRTYLGLKFYRGGCPAPGEVDEYVELTPQPIFDPDPAVFPYVLYQDIDPPAACHTYYVTSLGKDAAGVIWESKATVARYTYPYEPWQVMGQYAFGANLLAHADSIGINGAIVIPPGGGWELGSPLPGTPVVLKWRQHADSAVQAYRIWVTDINRFNLYGTRETWTWLADVPAWENTYLDYGAACNWPVEFKGWGDGEGTDWNLESCTVLTGWPGPGCGAQPSGNNDLFGYLSYYYVEGLTDPESPHDSAPFLPPDGFFPTGPLMPNPWSEAVRAVRLCEGVCPNDDMTCNEIGATDLNCYGKQCGDGTHSDLWLEAPLQELPATEMALMGSSLLDALLGGDYLDVDSSGEERPGRLTALPTLGSLDVMDLQGARLIRSNPRRVVNTNPQPAPDREVGQVAPNSRIEWLHPDHLGSTRLVTASSGAVVSRHKYLPFGKEYVDDIGASPNTHKFTGHERDEDTGLDYMFARYYGPQNLFRFLSVDPADVAVTNLQGMNAYTYASNNPVSLMDPDGKSPLFGGLPPMVAMGPIASFVNWWVSDAGEAHRDNAASVVGGVAGAVAGEIVKVGPRKLAGAGKLGMAIPLKEVAEGGVALYEGANPELVNETYKNMMNFCMFGCSDEAEAVRIELETLRTEGSKADKTKAVFPGGAVPRAAEIMRGAGSPKQQPSADPKGAIKQQNKAKKRSALGGTHSLSGVVDGLKAKGLKVCVDGMCSD